MASSRFAFLALLFPTKEDDTRDYDCTTRSFLSR